ncbi:MAG TPA: RHS repeat-associated core domain-containing protein [Mycobacteriales bacterium]
MWLTRRGHTTTPTLRGASSDADGSQVRIHFEVLNSAGTSVVVSGWSPWVSSNRNTSWTVPSGYLTNGTPYRWRARGYDGSLYSKSYSSLVDFTVDTTAPNTPTSSSTAFAQNAWSNANDAATGTLDGSFTFGTNGSGDVDGYYWGLDENPPTEYQTATTLSVTDVAEGAHTLYVQSVDGAGNRSPLRSYAFDVGHAAVTSPAVGARTEAGLTLSGIARTTYPKAQWKWRRSANDSWTPVTGLTDLSNNVVSQPLTITSGALPTVKWAVAAAAVGADGPFEVAIDVLDANNVVQQTTQPRRVTLDRADFGSVTATQPIGPASVNLITGNAQLGATDATLDAFGSDLSVSRTHNSRAPQAGGTDGPFGPEWTAAALVSSAGTDYVSLTAATNLVTVTLADSDTLTFTKSGSTWVPENGAEGTSLTYAAGPPATWTLTDVDGMQTTFTQPSGSTDFRPSTVKQPADTAATTYTHETVDADPDPNVTRNVTRVTRMVTPQPAGVSCASYSSRGCRSVAFTYAANNVTPPSSGTFGDYPNRLRKVSATMWDPTTSAMTTVDIAAYDYDSAGRLHASWDPRLSSPLKTVYGYDSGGRVTSVTPPGELAWTLGYDGSDPGRLLTVSRPSLPSGTAVTTVRYGVAVSGTGAPADLSPAELDRIAQADRPVTATAVFPPNHQPGSPVDYTYATVHYLDIDGREVNTRLPGGHLTTTEYDSFGNVVRTLSAANRARALDRGATTDEEAAIANLLSSLNVYSADGLELRETFGPEHDVQLSDGTIARARAHTVNTYDEGATGGPYHLVTTSVTGARVTGDTVDRDTRTSKTEYDFAKRLATKTIVDPTGLNLRSLTTYNSAGLVTKTTLPGGLGAQTTAHTTRTVYWTAGSNSDDSACGNRPEWVNLVCATGPVAQPTSGLPEVPTTYTRSYDAFNRPLVVEEVAGSTVHRTTTTTYDAAGRTDTVSVTASTGASVPTVKTLYDSSTGRAVRTQTLGSGGTVTAEVVRGYDTLGRLTSYDDATSAPAATTSYDDLGRPTSTYDGKRTTTRSYQESVDPRGLLTELVDPVAGTFSATYDADGNVATVTYPNGMTATWTYDETGSAVAVEYARNGTSWLSDSVIEIVHGQWLTHAGVSEQDFGYDAAGRLTSVVDRANGACTKRAYAVDADSNRTQTTTWLPTDDGACQTATSSSVSYSHDEAARATATGYVYDALGRTTTVPAAAARGGSAVTASYHVNDLVSTLTQNGATTTYTLDVVQDRFASWTDGTSTWTNHYAGDADSAAWTEKSGSPVTWTRNVAGIGGDLAAVEAYDGTSSVVTLQLVSLHGDLIGEAPASGTTLGATFDSDEFGNRRLSSTRRYEWLGAKTRAADNPGGIVLMGVRLYNPVTGRFLSVDPVPGGSDNRYDYAGHDPTNAFDLDGRRCSSTRRNKSWWSKRACSISNHWRGPAQVAVTIAGTGVAGACTGITLGLGAVACAAGAGAGTAGAVHALGSKSDKSLKGYGKAAGFGALTFGLFAAAGRWARWLRRPPLDRLKF